jgi:hypothetical protein
MVPARVVVLPAFPRLANGKVDRRGLPDPDRHHPHQGDEVVAPRTDVEAVLAAAWCAVLGADEVSVRDKFFDVGGNSLRLVDVAERIDERWPGVIAVAELFELPTIEELAARIVERTATATDGDRDGARREHDPVVVAGYEL